MIVEVMVILREAQDTIFFIPSEQQHPIVSVSVK